jgi:hypothetical protein
VFVGSWHEFLLCESDQIFVQDFAEVAAELIRMERATCCCLLNFDRTPVIEYERAAALFFDEALTKTGYHSLLKEGGSSSGWIYHMERYGCASDIGEWCIYSEKNNDIAVIALRNPDGAAKFSSPLKKLYAHSIQTFLEMGPSSPIPFSMLVEPWKRGLLENYSHAAAAPDLAGPSDGGSPTR